MLPFNGNGDLKRLLRELLVLVCSRIVENIASRIKSRIEDQARRKKRTVWVKPWLLRRHQLGAYELANEDIEGYVAFQRLAPELFAELLAKVEPLIMKKDTIMRESVSAGARLAITLRYLATGKKTDFFIS